MKAIERTINWYRSQPTAGKVLFAIPLVLLLVGIVILLIVTAGRFGSGSSDNDLLSNAKDLHEGMIDAEIDAAKKRDAELAKKEEAVDREIDGLDDEAKKRAEDREKEHASIDGADNIADVDRAMRGRDGR